MKKYLMMGAAALAFGFAAVSCSNNDDISVSKQDQYKAAFEKEFGKVDPNQTWGFDGDTRATRTHNTNRNEWGKPELNTGIWKDCKVPANITESEYDLVVAYFSVKREGAVNQNNVNWTDYFITEVYKGTDVYKDGNNQTVKGSDKMNHLQVKKAEGDLLPPDNACWEHANDFNNGDHNADYQDIEGHTLMLNSGTLDFAYHNSTDSKYHNEYIIIPGSVIDPSGALDNYYYIGFDFYATHPEGQESNKNMDVDRNWVFNDWIVRISPAEFIGQKRIYVEDLIANSLQNVDKSDWDFNDAVFDVYINYNPDWHGNDCAVITLRAAGGTLDLRIAGREVHELFGVPQTTMVNTGVGAEVAPVQFRLAADELTSKDANDIKVVVTTETGEKIELLAKKGEATQKFAVPMENHVKWLKERQHISSGYELFPEYVRNAAITTWWNPAVESPLYQKWY